MKRGEQLKYTGSHKMRARMDFMRHSKAPLSLDVLELARARGMFANGLLNLMDVDEMKRCFEESKAERRKVG
jgi:hypothetical protein